MNKLKDLLDKLFQTFLSVLKICLYSTFVTRRPRQFSNNDEIVILGNGPSLNKTAVQASGFLSGKSLACVNFFVNSELYTKLQPEIYVIADPFFWILEKNLHDFFEVLTEKTTWNISLLIPNKALKYKEWQAIVKKNPHIKVYIYNTTPIEGSQAFCNFVIKKGLGVPRPHNVLIPAISLALRLSFTKIYLAGADHSWLKEISVDDDNNVLVNQKHCYDEHTSKAQSVKQENLSSAKLYIILYHLHIAFKQYFILRNYAGKVNKKIYNITPNSFIDAFERKQV